MNLAKIDYNSKLGQVKPFLPLDILLSVILYDRGLQLATTGGLATRVELEYTLNHGHLSGGGIDSTEGCPVVDNHTGTNNVGTSVDGSRGQWDLEKLRQLIHLRDGSARMDQATLVGQGAERSHQEVTRNRGSEHLCLEGIYDDLLRLAVNVGVGQGNIVVSSANVTQS